MTLGEQIKAARKDRGLTQAQVAERLRVSREAVQQWEAGDTAPKGRRLRELAHCLGVDINYLLLEASVSASDQAGSNHGHPQNDSRMLTIEELDVRAGMSLGGYVQGGEALGIELVKAKWQIPSVVIRHYSGSPQEAIKIITAVGDSNVPEFFPGDRVMVDTADRVPSPPGFFAIWDGFGEVIKRLEMIPYSDPPRVRLLSANGAYEPRELPLDMVVINGRVLGKWKWT